MSALGWVIGETNGVAYFGKQGGGLGFHGNIRLYPSLGIGTALLVNSTEVSAGPIDARRPRSACLRAADPGRRRG